VLDGVADVVGVGLVEAEAVAETAGDDAAAELLVTAEVAGADALWDPPAPALLPLLVDGCPLSAKASAAPPAPSTMATPTTSATRTGRRRPGRRGARAS